jgi:hypothetical protein
LSRNRNKTQPTEASVESFLVNLDDEKKRADSCRLIEIMRGITGEPATMWGPGIVGFGTYHYSYESGREGDMPITGFSPRKAALTLYLMGDWQEHADLLERLGKHRLGKGCVYIKRLADVDEDILTELISRAAQKFVGCEIPPHPPLSSRAESMDPSE